LPRSLINQGVIVLAIALCLGCSGDHSTQTITDDTPSTTTEDSTPGDWFLLQPGLTWTYEIREHTGSGPRFFFIPTEPARQDSLGTWTLRLGPATDQGRFSASLVRAPTEGLRSTSEFELWMEGDDLWLDDGAGARPAVVFSRPPNPVTTERVPCVANLLNGIHGRCAPAWGGPLNTAPGLQTGVVGTQTKEGAGAAQLLVGVATGGLIIPGNKSQQTLATLSRWEGGPEATVSPLYAAWGQQRALKPEDVRAQVEELLQRHQVRLDVETASALVAVQQGAGARATALGLIDALSPASRLPLTRVMLQQQPTTAEAWMGLSGALESLPSSLSPEHKASLLDKFAAGTDREVATALLDGRCPLSRAALQRAPSARPVDLVESARAAELVPSPDDPSCLLRMVVFDTSRRELLNVMLERADPALHPRLIEVSLSLFQFDRERLEVLREHRDSLRDLPAPQRERLVATLSFKGATARAILDLPTGAN